MSTASIRSRLPAAALCLAVLLLAASPPALAQTAWDQQDQADMFGRLAAQGLLRSPASLRAGGDRDHVRACKVCREAGRRDTQPAPTRSREAGRGNGAGADPRRTFGHESGLRALPSPVVAVRSEDEVTTTATPSSVREPKPVLLL